nr:MAG TPA: hypothetical protein [Caudoviricetes sp.]
MILHIHIYCKPLFIFFKIFVPGQFPRARQGRGYPPSRQDARQQLRAGAAVLIRTIIYCTI